MQNKEKLKVSPTRELFEEFEQQLKVMSKRKHIKENFHLDDDDEKGVEAPVHKFDIAETEFDRRKIK